MLSLTFSQSFFEQNVSIQLKLLRFSSILVTFEIKPEMQDVLEKMRELSQNAGIKPKCGISRTIAGRLTPMRNIQESGVVPVDIMRHAMRREGYVGQRVMVCQGRE